MSENEGFEVTESAEELSDSELAGVAGGTEVPTMPQRPDLWEQFRYREIPITVE